MEDKQGGGGGVFSFSLYSFPTQDRVSDERFTFW